MADRPRELPEALVDALTALAGTERLLVALDFDGTLAPEVDDPEKARATPEARAAVLRLLEVPNTRVALISGRAIRSLERVSDLPGSVLLVGSHGIEVRLDTAEPTIALDADELRRRDVLERVLSEIADPIDEVWIEEKPAGFALHTRLANERDSSLAQSAALEKTAAVDDGLTVRSGKNVLEFSVQSTTKGDGVAHLRTYTDATAVLFAGDDVTDEDGFAALHAHDVGLKCGPGDTVAEHRVDTPAEVAAALELLADLRERNRPAR